MQQGATGRAAAATRDERRGASRRARQNARRHGEVGRRRIQKAEAGNEQSWRRQQAAIGSQQRGRSAQQACQHSSHGTGGVRPGSPCPAAQRAGEIQGEVVTPVQCRQAAAACRGESGAVKAAKWCLQVCPSIECVERWQGAVMKGKVVWCRAQVCMCMFAGAAKAVCVIQVRSSC